MNASPLSADPLDTSRQTTPLTGGPGYFVAGSGTPVVMLHASLGSKSQWTALAQQLSARYRVIAIDLCGYGDNALAAARVSRFTLDDEVRLVTDRLDGLVDAHVRVHIVAHSYGGLVALRFTQSCRGRVASLSLYEPVVFRVLDDDDAALVNVKAMAQCVSTLVATGRRSEATRVFVDFWSGENAYASLPLPVQAGVARRVDKLLLDFRAASLWPLVPDDLRAIVAPCLLLAGSRSPEVVKRIHKRLALSLSNRSIVTFDCGHMGPVTDADRINPRIEAFVNACAERETALALA